jgi:hypothetical protein
MFPPNIFRQTQIDKVGNLSIGPVPEIQRVQQKEAASHHFPAEERPVLRRSAVASDLPRFCCSFSWEDQHSQIIGCVAIYRYLMYPESDFDNATLFARA